MHQSVNCGAVDFGCDMIKWNIQMSCLSYPFVVSVALRYSLYCWEIVSSRITGFFVPASNGIPARPAAGRPPSLAARP